MIYDLIIVVTSPFILFVLLLVFLGIAVAINTTSGDFGLGNSGSHAASGVAVFLLLMLAISLLDIDVSCRLLVDNNLLQFEFIVIVFYALLQQGRKYINEFDTN